MGEKAGYDKEYWDAHYKRVKEKEIEDEIRNNLAYPKLLEEVIKPAYEILAKEFSGSIYYSPNIIKLITSAQHEYIPSLKGRYAETAGSVLRIEVPPKRTMYVYAEKGNDCLFTLSFLNEKLDKFYIGHWIMELETVEGIIETIKNKIPKIYPKYI